MVFLGTLKGESPLILILSLLEISSWTNIWLFVNFSIKRLFYDDWVVINIWCSSKSPKFESWWSECSFYDDWHGSLGKTFIYCSYSDQICIFLIKRFSLSTAGVSHYIGISLTGIANESAYRDDLSFLMSILSNTFNDILVCPCSKIDC